MNAKPSLPATRPAAHFVAAMLAGIVAVGLLAGVAALFQRDGQPMERLVAAERACAGRAFVSERDACMRDWLAARTLADRSAR
jgi:hypothetical protein